MSEQQKPTELTVPAEKAVKPVKKPENKPAKKESKKSAIYTIALPIISFLFKTILPVKYHGLENIPEKAPYILMGNHLSMLDPFVMGVTVKKIQIRFLGKKELWNNPILRFILNNMKMIPVDRHNSDMEAMRACMRVIREGGVLGIFPEGTRHKEGLMEDLESGTALIALRGRVPLVPVYIPRKLGLFRTLHVYVGQPIVTQDLLEQGVNKESCQLLMGRITETYREMAESSGKALIKA